VRENLLTDATAVFQRAAYRESKSPVTSGGDKISVKSGVLLWSFEISSGFLRRKTFLLEEKLALLRGEDLSAQ